MLSVTASSTSIHTWSADLLLLPPGPIPNGIQVCSKAMRASRASASADAASVEDRDKLIERLYFAVVRWKQRPEIAVLLEGVELPFKTDDDREKARSLVPHILTAIEEAEAEYLEQRSRSGPIRGARGADTQARAENEHPVTIDRLLKCLVAVAIKWCGYRGPEERRHAVSLIHDALDLVGLSVDEQTIRKYLDEGAKLIDDGNWPDD